MRNESCLAGMRCPKCGSYGQFRITTHCFTDWSDDGTGDSRDYEIDLEGSCVCLECQYHGTVPDFKEVRLTWADLQEKISKMSPEQRNTDVTMFDTNDGEFFKLCELRFTEPECDVLDGNHPFLTVLDYTGEEYD